MTCKVYTCLQKDCRKTYNNRLSMRAITRGATRIKFARSTECNNRIAGIPSPRFQTAARCVIATKSSRLLHVGSLLSINTAGNIGSARPHGEMRLKSGLRTTCGYRRMIWNNRPRIMTPIHGIVMDCAALNSALCSSCPVCGWSSQQQNHTTSDSRRPYGIRILEHCHFPRCP